MSDTTSAAGPGCAKGMPANAAENTGERMHSARSFATLQTLRTCWIALHHTDRLGDGDQHAVADTLLKGIEELQELHDLLEWEQLQRDVRGRKPS